MFTAGLESLLPAPYSVLDHICTDAVIGIKLQFLAPASPSFYEEKKKNTKTKKNKNTPPALCLVIDR